MERTVIIDCFPESVQRYQRGYAIVTVDVIRATTTAVTGVSLGRRCFPVPTIEDAFRRAMKLEHPLFVGELGGNKPYGFDLTNSPVELVRRRDKQRPMILLSTSGTQLMCAASECDVAFVACFRNAVATAAYLQHRYEHVAVIGAGSRGDFREEDNICCAWVASRLMDAGFAPEDNRTQTIVKDWGTASPNACYVSKSVGYLRRTKQVKDLTFILSHVNDLNSAFMLANNEILEIPLTKPERELEFRHLPVEQEKQPL